MKIKEIEFGIQFSLPPIPSLFWKKGDKMENDLNDKIQQIIDRLLSLANQVYYLHSLCPYSDVINKLHRELLVTMAALSKIRE